MASITGLSGIGLPKFSPNMDPEDAREIYNYLYQLQEQVRYILTNIDTENLSEDMTATLAGLESRLAALENE